MWISYHSNSQSNQSSKWTILRAPNSTWTILRTQFYNTILQDSSTTQFLNAILKHNSIETDLHFWHPLFRIRKTSFGLNSILYKYLLNKPSSSDVRCLIFIETPHIVTLLNPLHLLFRTFSSHSNNFRFYKLHSVPFVSPVLQTQLLSSHYLHIIFLITMYIHFAIASILSPQSHLRVSELTTISTYNLSLHPSAHLYIRF